MKNKIKGNIVTDENSFYGEIEFNDEIINITKVSKIKENENWILPGFIDLHVHGGGGSDIMEGELAIRNMLTCHAKNGTTSLLATTLTDTPEKLNNIFQSIASVMNAPARGEAQIIGVHLEGPFISPDKLGAQPAFSRAFDLEEVLSLHEIAPIKIITLAPESNISDSEVVALKKKNILLQIGHSNADYETSKEFIENKADSVTHVFNAMSGFHHRAPGLTGASLAHAQCAELIPDLLHVHPGAIKVALRSIPKLYFVTDATAACGMPDGTYRLGTHEVHKCGNGIRLADGTLAGSSLTMIQALKNILSLDLSIVESSKRLSYIQAHLLGASDRGCLKIGNRADILVIDDSYDLLDVYLQGRSL